MNFSCFISWIPGKNDNYGVDFLPKITITSSSTCPRMNIHASLDEYIDFQKGNPFSAENIKLEGCDSGTICKKEANR